MEPVRGKVGEKQTPDLEEKTHKLGKSTLTHLLLLSPRPRKSKPCVSSMYNFFYLDVVYHLFLLIKWLVQ